MTLFNKDTMAIYDPAGPVAEFLNGVIENKELLVVVNGTVSNDSVVDVGYVAHSGYEQSGRITQICLTRMNSINPFSFHVFNAIKDIQYISSTDLFGKTSAEPMCYAGVVKSTEMFSGGDAVAKLHELNDASKESMRDLDMGINIDSFLEQI